MSNGDFGGIDLNTPENKKNYIGNEINEELDISEASIEESGELDLIEHRMTLKDSNHKKQRNSMLKKSANMSNAQ